MEMDALTEVLDDLAGRDPSTLADPESLIELQRSICRLEAIFTSAVGEFDTWGGYAPEGAQSTAAWLAARCQPARRRST